MAIKPTETTIKGIVRKSVKLSHLGIDDSVKVRLSFDECKKGEGQFGEWHLYSGEFLEPALGECSFFASNTLHYELVKYRKGDVLTITAIEKTNGSGKVYKGYNVKKVSVKMTEEEKKEVVELIKNTPGLTTDKVRETLITLGYTAEEDISDIIKAL